jgi:hypothetical protein
MKTYPRDAAVDWDAIRRTSYGIHSTPTEVIVYESADEVPPPAPPPANPVPQEVTVLQAMKALDAAGMSAAYEAWANAPERTFIELAFINRSTHWVRTDPIMLSGSAAIGISEAQLDDLFRLAATL